MKIFSFSLLALFMVSSAAFAGHKAEAEKAQDATVTTLNFEDLRAACLNPASFHNQVAPKNIQVSCKDIQAKWVPDTDGSLSMNTQRQVSISVMSDKYTAAEMTGSVVSAAQVMACPQFKQITESVEVVHATTCDELVAFSGSGVDFCVGQINSLRASNPQAVTTTATGQTVSFCAGGQEQARAH